MRDSICCHRRTPSESFTVNAALAVSQLHHWNDDNSRSDRFRKTVNFDVSILASSSVCTACFSINVIHTRKFDFWSWSEIEGPFLIRRYTHVLFQWKCIRGVVGEITALEIALSVSGKKSGEKYPLKRKFIATKLCAEMRPNFTPKDLFLGVNNFRGNEFMVPCSFREWALPTGCERIPLVWFTFGPA